MYIDNVLKVKNEWWRYIIGCFVVFIATQIGSIPFIIAIFSKAGLEGAAKIDQTSMMTILGDSNLTFFYVLLTFLFGLIGLFLVVKYLHDQSFLSISTSRKKINFSKIANSFLVACSIILITTITSYLIFPDDYEYNFELKPFLILCLISFLLVPFQTSWEEYMFRGYLMQGIGAIVKNKWIPLLITSLSLLSPSYLVTSVSARSLVVVVVPSRVDVFSTTSRRLRRLRTKPRKRHSPRSKISLSFSRR